MFQRFSKMHTYLYGNTMSGTPASDLQPIHDHYL